MTKKATMSVLYLSVFTLLATYLARDAGWLNEGRLYWTLLYAASIVLFAAVLWNARLRSLPASVRQSAAGDLITERSFVGIAVLAVVALIVVEVARALGYLQDRNLFLTLNACLPLIALVMMYQLYMRRKRRSNVP